MVANIEIYATMLQYLITKKYDAAGGGLRRGIDGIFWSGRALRVVCCGDRWATIIRLIISGSGIEEIA
jgi:hypothetical protein